MVLLKKRGCEMGDKRRKVFEDSSFMSHVSRLMSHVSCLMSF